MLWWSDAIDLIKLRDIEHDRWNVDTLSEGAFFVEFSQEQFRLMGQDIVIMFGKRKEIIDNPAFRRLDAVGEDRVIYLDLEDQCAGALGFSSR